jgi:carboxypeptidase D
MNYRRDTSSADFNLTTCDFNGGTTTAAQVTAIVNGLGPDAAQDCALFGPCDTFDAAAYWIADSGNQAGCWNQYNIDYPCDETVDSTAGFVAYLNQPEVQSAIHAPQIQFHLSNYAVQFLLGSEHVVPPAYSIIPNLLAAGTKVHIWSGQKDYFLNHIGTELAIQNMTWNGAQGLQNPPNKKFYDCQNNLAGTYGAERGLSYHLFKDAGHQTPMDDPSAVFAFVENTVVGSSGSNRH